MQGKAKGPLVYRQALSTRATHWIWVVCLFFLLLSGLQIFQAHPRLYIGHESGFAYDNSVFAIGALRDGAGGLSGFTELLGQRFDTTGWLGAVEQNGQWQAKSFPGWLTVPSYRDLASGRIVHFFFAWILVTALLVWLLSSLFNRHLTRDLLPRADDMRALGADIRDHARLRPHNRRRYGPLQKLSYALVMLVLLPLMILSGLTMSPGMNAFAPFLVDLFGGRQSARTVHFVVMLLLLGFVVVHVLMVLLAGPFNEMRSMITGWFRVDADEAEKEISR